MNNVELYGIDCWCGSKAVLNSRSNLVVLLTSGLFSEMHMI